MLRIFDLKALRLSCLTQQEEESILGGRMNHDVEHIDCLSLMKTTCSTLAFLLSSCMLIKLYRHRYYNNPKPEHSTSFEHLGIPSKLKAMYFKGYKADGGHYMPCHFQVYTCLITFTAIAAIGSWKELADHMKYEMATRHGK